MGNVERDIRNTAELQKLGWNVIVIWECELKKKCFEQTMDSVIYELNKTYVNNKSEELLRFEEPE